MKNEEVRSLLTPCADRLTVRRDGLGCFDLWSKKDVVVAGRQAGRQLYEERDRV